MKYVKSYGQCCALWFDIFIIFQNIVSIGFDVSSTVYFHFRNYHITGVVFIFTYRFRFQWKNVKVKVVEYFADRFRPFSSRSTGCKTARVVCVEDAWSDQNVVRGRLVYNSCSFQISERGEILTRGCRGAPVHWATTACFGCIYLHC